MKAQGRLAIFALLLLGVFASSTFLALAHDGGGPRGGGGVNSLRRALTQANAPALTTDQEAQINTLITTYRNALPDNDDALEQARDAFEAAVLAGNTAAAQMQAQNIANLIAAETRARLNAQAQFDIAVLNLLRNGGQLTPLVNTFGNDRVFSLISGLVNGPKGGRF